MDEADCAVAGPSFQCMRLAKTSSWDNDPGGGRVVGATVGSAPVHFGPLLSSVERAGHSAESLSLSGWWRGVGWGSDS
jgi:hypothetical protein